MDQRSPWLTVEQARSYLQQGTGRGIKVAVIDSGVEPGMSGAEPIQLADDLAIVEQDLHLRVVPGEGKDVYGHGTAIAQIIRRVAPEVTLGSVRVLGAQLRSRTATISAGVRVAMDLGYHILNCSFGCARADHLQEYKDWVDEAYLRGRHVVAASNNEDFTQCEWPGHFPTVITVRFIKAEDPLTLFYRPGHLVEFAAAGEDLEVGWAGGAKKKVTGSSFAAPHVTGMLARLLSGCPTLSPLQAKGLLQHLATPAV